MKVNDRICRECGKPVKFTGTKDRLRWRCEWCGGPDLEWDGVGFTVPAPAVTAAAPARKRAVKRAQAFNGTKPKR